MHRVADAAHPFDYSILPDDVNLVLGYVGQVGSTPHVWTNAEIAAVATAGKHWRAIWVPPQRALTKQDGVDAAAGMTAALAGRGYPKGVSVFLDIEYSSYQDDPWGAVQCAAAWKDGMAAAGWPLAYWYGPLDSPADWIAHWTGLQPASLPPGVIGVQYDHALDGDRYDLSVFDDALWTREEGSTMPLDPANPYDKQVIDAASTDQTHPSVANIGTIYHGVIALRDDVTHDSIHLVRQDLVKLAGKVDALTTALADLTKLVGALTPGGTPIPAAYTFTGTGQITPGA